MLPHNDDHHLVSGVLPISIPLILLRFPSNTCPLLPLKPLPSIPVTKPSTSHPFAPPYNCRRSTEKRGEKKGDSGDLSDGWPRSPRRRNSLPYPPQWQSDVCMLHFSDYSPLLPPISAPPCRSRRSRLPTKSLRWTAKVNEDASGDVMALHQQIHKLKPNSGDFDNVSNSAPRGSPDIFNNTGLLNKKMNYLEATLLGSLRREKIADATVRRLEADISHMNRFGLELNVQRGIHCKASLSTPKSCMTKRSCACRKPHW